MNAGRDCPRQDQTGLSRQNCRKGGKIGGNYREPAVLDENGVGFVSVDCWFWGGSLPALNFPDKVAKEERLRYSGSSWR
jgi:hypothetical protein